MLLPKLRVLDLTDEKGFLCGKILGDLGADVIKIEPPGGDPSRNIGPFYHDILDPEKSLYWFAFNNNKSGITLNIETTDGQDILKRLINQADILIESFDPGYMDGLGLGYTVLSEINPCLIMVSITPFGQTGPYKDYKSSDIVSMAMSGFMYICGDPDRPPVRISVPQASLHAGAEGAVGAMIAYFHRQITGEGQHVDISMQESMVLCLSQVPAYWQINGIRLKRDGCYRVLSSGVRSRMIWPCKDGYITFLIHGGPLGSKTNQAVTEWMDEEGIAPTFMKEMKWDNFDLRVASEDRLRLLEKSLINFFSRHTKEELYTWAIEKQIMLCPVFNSAELLENQQLRDRGFWVELEHPELNDTIIYPGAFIKISEMTYWMQRRAPLIGENNLQIYEGELGISKENLVILKQSGVI